MFVQTKYFTTLRISDDIRLKTGEIFSVAHFTAAFHCIVVILISARGIIPENTIECIRATIKTGTLTLWCFLMTSFRKIKIDVMSHLVREIAHNDKEYLHNITSNYSSQIREGEKGEECQGNEVVFLKGNGINTRRAWNNRAIDERTCINRLISSNSEIVANFNVQALNIYM